MQVYITIMSKMQAVFTAAKAFVLLLLLVPHPAYAQVTTQMGAHFATAAAISSSATTELDFGTWAVNVEGSDTPQIFIEAVVSGAPDVPTPSGISDPSTLVRNTVAPENSGTITINSPTPVMLQIKAIVTSDFSDPNLSLSGLVFTDSVVSNTTIPTDYDGATRVTVNGTSETIGIGGTLTLGSAGGSPAPETIYNDAVMDVSFTY